MTRREVIISIVIGILLVFHIISFNKISDIDRRMHEVNYLQHEVQNVHQSVNNISANVYNAVDQFMQEQLWVAEKNYQITDVNMKENTIDVILEWTLRDKLPQEEITFLYRDLSNQEWTELPVLHRNGLNYAIEYTFPLRGDYATQVLATSPEGDRSESLLELNFKRQLDTRVQIHAYVQYDGNKYIDFNIDIFNRLEDQFMIGQKQENLKMKTAYAYLIIDGHKVKEYDLLKENHHFHVGEYDEALYTYENFHYDGEVKKGVELQVIIEDGLGLKYEEVVTTHN